MTDRPRQVLLACHRFPPDRLSGVERITQALAAELARGGDRVTVVTRRPYPPSATLTPPELLHSRLADGTTVYRLTGSLEMPGKFLAHEPHLRPLLAGILARTAPDVVHILHLLNLSPSLLESCQRLGIAVVVSAQDFYFACHRVHLLTAGGQQCAGPDGGRACARDCFPGGAGGRWVLRTAYFRKLLQLADRVICPSHHVAGFFHEFGVEQRRIRVIPNGVSLTAASPAHLGLYSQPATRGVMNVAFVGSVIPSKGVHLILDALELARLPSVCLYLFGETQHALDYVHDLRDRARTIPGLRLRTYGRYHPTDLALLLHDMDCLVLPSVVRESYGIAPREALSRGVPILVSRLGALPEAVREGENGFTFDHRHPAELANLLRRLWEDDGELPKLRRGSLRSPVMSQPHHAQEVRSTYEEAIAERARTGVNPPGALKELESLRTTLWELGFGGQG